MDGKNSGEQEHTYTGVIAVYKRLTEDKPLAVRWICNAVILFGLLYLFLLGLSLMGNAFKGMSGKRRLAALACDELT